MRLLGTAGLALGLAITMSPVTHSYGPPAPHHAPEVTRELVVVYLGTAGADGSEAMQKTIRDMKQSLGVATHLAHMNLVTRGVSLEPEVVAGMRELAALGPFDEVSLGGNWTNSLVVRYLGPSMGRENQNAYIPQVVVLEREVTRDGPSSLRISAEREIKRFNVSELPAWVAAGTPLPPTR